MNDENKKTVLQELKSLENRFEEYIKNMETFIKDFKSNMPKDQNWFILFGNCNVGTTMPDCFPKLKFPNLLRYEKQLNYAAILNDDVTLNYLFGCLFDGRWLHRNYVNGDLRVINAASYEIASLAYRCQDDTFWLNTEGDILQVDRTGNVIHKIATRTSSVKNKPIAVTPTGSVVYRQSQFIVNELKYSGITKKILTSRYSAPLCLWARKEGGVLVGYSDNDESDGGFLWLSNDAVEEKKDQKRLGLE